MKFALARHTPPIAKQPPERLKPTFEVEVAEPLIVRPERVVVPKPVLETERSVVEALLRPFTTSNALPMLELDQMVVVAYGVEVPMAKLPVEVKRARSRPLVEKPMVLAIGAYIPVSISAIKEYEGEPARFVPPAYAAPVEVSTN